MIKLLIRNLQTMTVFEKFFDSYYDCKNFIRKCKKSRKVKILEISSDVCNVEELIYM